MKNNWRQLFPFLFLSVAAANPCLADAASGTSTATHSRGTSAHPVTTPAGRTVVANGSGVSERLPTTASGRTFTTAPQAGAAAPTSRAVPDNRSLDHRQFLHRHNRERRLIFVPVYPYYGYGMYPGADFPPAVSDSPVPDSQNGSFPGAVYASDPKLGAWERLGYDWGQAVGTGEATVDQLVEYLKTGLRKVGSAADRDAFREGFVAAYPGAGRGTVIWDQAWAAALSNL